MSREKDDDDHALVGPEAAQHFVGDATFVVDHELRSLVAEGDALAAAGFEPSNFVGKTVFEVFAPELVVGGGLKTRFSGGHDALFDRHQHQLADAWRCTPAHGQRGRRLQGPVSGLRKGDRGLVDGAGTPGARRA